MPTYIAIVDFTEQGVRTIAASASRAEAFRSQASSIGATVKDIYWTAGGHDGILIFEAPDDTIASAACLSLAKGGNLRTQMLRAFNRAEFEAVVGAMK